MRKKKTAEVETTEPDVPVEAAAATEDVSIDTTSGKDLQMVSVTRLTPNPNNPRRKLTKEEEEALKASVREHGVLQPILVRTTEKADSHEIVAGERRWRAAKAAGLKEIPAVVRTMTPKQSAEIAIIENVQRSDMNAMMVAESYRHLMVEFSMTPERIAQRVSRSVEVVERMIKLTELPKDVQAAIAKGELTASHGMELTTYAAFPEHCSVIARRCIKDEISVRALATGVPEVYDLSRSGLMKIIYAGDKLADDPDIKKVTFKAASSSGNTSTLVCFRPDEYKRKQEEQVALQQQEAVRVLEEAKASGSEILTEETLKSVNHIAFRSYTHVPKACSEACQCRAKMLDRDGGEVQVCLNPERLDTFQKEEKAVEKAKRTSDAQKSLKKAQKALARRRDATWGGLIGALLLSRFAHAGKAATEEAFSALRLDFPKELFQGSKKEPEKIAALLSYTPDHLIEVATLALLHAEADALMNYGAGRTPLTDFILAVEPEQTSLTAAEPEPHDPFGEAAEGNVEEKDPFGEM